ncbi:PASILLA splice variant 3-like 2KH domains-containing protein [Cryptosporidium canis]|uniref:PASILLA splice variant 3-like 2KH domains-containing protein n=1 Tax=Cryptosporidium canis TaxID=195482 RepID=A0A9D5DHG6_9CRYT|nr:PASILLA splice variant 3-like 2KH domains-containing protein [Cryptosporidium canis]
MNMNRPSLERLSSNTHVNDDEENIVFVKLLINDSAANKILSNSGSILRKIRQVNHVFILVSGSNKYFPGTNYRVATLEGSERNVNETMEVLDFLLKSDERSENFRSYEYNIRLAVPRSVIGSIIGIKGEFISHVRTVTSAHINISPIFVTSDKACNERIITISGNNSNHVVHAFIILTKKVNSSPEGRSCKTIIYRRADIFRKKDQRPYQEKADPLLSSQLQEMRNALNGEPINSTGEVVSESSERKEKPKLNFKLASSDRWSDNVDILANDENSGSEEFESELKEVEVIQQGLIEGVQMKITQQDDSDKDTNEAKNYPAEKLYDCPPKTVQNRIPTNIFIISFIALVTGALFLQYISREIIHA